MRDVRRGESEVRRLSDPTVCAILLTADRPEYARRAVECFRRQTYTGPKRLLVIASGVYDEPRGGGDLYPDVILGVSRYEQATIGTLRNFAGEATACLDAEILIHWDDDDYSHPNRIAEQVALLQSSGADVVGYREILFWREPFGRCICRGDGLMGMRCDAHGEAWLYSNPDPRYCLGTSLCYWRKTWERKPFEATSQGEDVRFCTGLDCVGVSSLQIKIPYGSGDDSNVPNPFNTGPRMIARIHSGNTSTAYRSANPSEDRLRLAELQGSCWKRTPEWDSYCRGVCE